MLLSEDRHIMSRELQAQAGAYPSCSGLLVARGRGSSVRVAFPCVRVDWTGHLDRLCGLSVLLFPACEWTGLDISTGYVAGGAGAAQVHKYL
jgi:hypothetical protein